jgi:hypothetical protein
VIKDLFAKLTSSSTSSLLAAMPFEDTQLQRMAQHP